MKDERPLIIQAIDHASAVRLALRRTPCLAGVELDALIKLLYTIAQNESSPAQTGL